MELTFSGGGVWPYLLVFVAAAIPVLEVLVVIPAGVLAGLSPVPTAMVAFAGNLTTVVLVALVGDRFIRWWRTRRPAKERSNGTKARRARELLRRWGVPGFAFVAPLTTGTHVATLAALATGAETRRVLRWMATGLLVWSIAAAAVTAAGLDVFT